MEENFRKDNHPAALLSKSYITGFVNPENDRIFFQPCDRDPNGCVKLGELTGSGGHICKLIAHCNGVVICGNSGSVNKL